MPTEFEKPAVFISYPRVDEQIARKLRDCLVTLTPNVDVLLDQEVIPPGDDFESDIYSYIKRSHWFVIICSGDLDSDKNFDWCYYEAGQFRSIMTGSLIQKHGGTIDDVVKKDIDDLITRGHLWRQNHHRRFAGAGISPGRSHGCYGLEVVLPGCSHAPARYIGNAAPGILESSFQE